MKDFVDFVKTLEASPDEAFIQDDGKVAYVFDTERNEILYLVGDFTGFREKIAWELRNAMAKQHPRVYDL